MIMYDGEMQPVEAVGLIAVYVDPRPTDLGRGLART